MASFAGDGVSDAEMIKNWRSNSFFPTKQKERVVSQRIISDINHGGSHHASSLNNPDVSTENHSLHDHESLQSKRLGSYLSPGPAAFARCPILIYDRRNEERAYVSR